LSGVESRHFSSAWSEGNRLKAVVDLDGIEVPDAPMQTVQAVKG